jgi:hypothetical protein
MTIRDRSMCTSSSTVASILSTLVIIIARNSYIKTSIFIITRIICTSVVIITADRYELASLFFTAGIDGTFGIVVTFLLDVDATFIAGTDI